MNTQSAQDLDAAIQIAFRTQVLAALQNPNISPAEIIRLMKTYQKSLDQELKAEAQQLKKRELALKERRLEQKERQEAAKESECELDIKLDDIKFDDDDEKPLRPRSSWSNKKQKRPLETAPGNA
jgi:NACalpha-BTF3-like transcription factor